MPDELADAVRALMQGGAALEPAVAARLLERISDTGDELSARELEVLRLVVRGASNKAIAARLNLSENTVKSHMSHIFAKLQVQSRAEAVATALKRGLVPMGEAEGRQSPATARARANRPPSRPQGRSTTA